MRIVLAGLLISLFLHLSETFTPLQHQFGRHSIHARGHKNTPSEYDHISVHNVEIERLEGLLDRASVLFDRSRPNSSHADQLSSLMDFLERKRAWVGLLFTTTTQKKAAEIDEALLRGASTEELQVLTEEYRKLKQSAQAFELLGAELEAIEKQLDGFEMILDFLDSSEGSVQSDDSSSPAPENKLSKPESKMLSQTLNSQYVTNNGSVDEEVDVAIIGAGLGGLCAGAILNTLYGKKVGIYESHYLAGGCAHSFDRKAPNGLTFTFDSGPTVLLGCSSEPYNALQQVLKAIDENVDWIAYDGWGMIEKPGKSTEIRWKVKLGPDHFEDGPLLHFGGEKAVVEFQELKKATKALLAGAEIPALAMRPGSSALFPLLRYLPTLVSLIQQGNTTTGTFAPFMDGPIFTVTNPWLRSWLDALAFSLSGLPAARTAAAAMAFVINDMHREGAALDYPRGGMGEIVNALVRGVEKGSAGSKVNLRHHVESIDFSNDSSRLVGLTLRNGKKVIARDGVICNAPVWSLSDLIKDDKAKQKLNDFRPLIQKPPTLSWTTTDEGASIKLDRDNEIDAASRSLLEACSAAEMTGSFLHLHLALNATGLDLDRLEAHYTVMDRSLSGDGQIINGVPDGPCGVLNMIAVSNPCVIDRTLAPEGFIVIHAYGAGNEPYELWQGLDRNSQEYQELKQKRVEPLWRAVTSVIPDAKERTVFELIGSPLTHERFLRRPRGTYGSATEDYLKDGATCYDSLLLASDGVFPGIGVPSVAIAGASAANGLVGVFKQWRLLDKLKTKGAI